MSIYITCIKFNYKSQAGTMLYIWSIRGLPQLCKDQFVNRLSPA